MSSSARIITLATFIGSVVGGYIPALWGASVFSYQSLIGSGVGSIIGIYLAYKYTSN